METFLCLPIHFAKVGKPVLGDYFLDTVGDALVLHLSPFPIIRLTAEPSFGTATLSIKPRGLIIWHLNNAMRSEIKYSD